MEIIEEIGGTEAQKPMLLERIKKLEDQYESLLKRQATMTTQLSTNTSKHHFENRKMKDVVQRQEFDNRASRYEMDELRSDVNRLEKRQDEIMFPKWVKKCIIIQSRLP